MNEGSRLVGSLGISHVMILVLHLGFISWSACSGIGCWAGLVWL